MGGKLVGREEEVAAVAALLRRTVAGRGGVLLIEGEAGSGKSSLLPSRPPRGGAALVRARGSELEREYPFGIARQLIGPIVAPGAGARPPRPVAALLGDPDGAPTDTASAARALTGFVADAASSRPLVLCVDDAHWADELSCRWLADLSRRVEDLPVALVIASRPGEPGSPAALRDISANPATRHLELQPLPREGVEMLVRSRFPKASADLVTACATTAGGNPFLTLSLLDGIATNGGDPGEEPARSVEELAPARVIHALAARAARLGPDAAALASAVAVLGRDVRLADAAALAGLDLSDAAEAADRLRAVRLLVGDPELEFVHPLARQAIYLDVPAGRRRESHRAAAAILARRGAPPEQVAAHLLRTHPAHDAEVARALAEAGREALRRGAPDAAATLLARAREEPPADADRHSIAVLQLRAEFASGRPAQALWPTFESVVREAPTPQLAAAAILSATPEFLTHELTPDFELAREVRRRLEPDEEPELTAQLEAVLLRASNLHPVLRQEHAVELERIAGLPGSNAGERALLAALAQRLALDAAPAEHVRALLARAGEDEAPWARKRTVIALLSIEDFAQAALRVNELVSESRRSGSVPLLVDALGLRARLLARTGRLREAESDMRELLPLSAEDAGVRGDHATLGWILAEQGRVEEADAVADMLPALPGPQEDNLWSVITDGYLGEIHLAAGRSTAALERFEHVGSIHAAMGVEGTHYGAWRSGVARARAGSGDARARELALSEAAAAARVPAPRARGLALLAAALVAPRPDPEELEAAVGILRESADPLALAKGLGALGGAQRRAKLVHQAREALGEALDLAARAGAAGLVERVREELIAAGLRPRRDLRSGYDALTPSELRVARLAAEGLSNPEIAQTLFVTRKTIEAHLGQVFRKLKVTSRDQLPSAMGAPPD